MKRIEVEVVKAFRGSEDGATVREFEVGVVAMEESLAAVALREGWAKKIEPAKVESAPTGDGAGDGSGDGAENEGGDETKGLTGAPENK